MNLIFCHLNADLPKYLRANIETTASRFPDNPIYVITDRPTNAFQAKNVVIHQFKGDSRIEDIHKNLSHPANFRNSFWTSSIARFVALAEFAREFDGPHLHVESDVVLFKRFPLSKFEKLPERLAYPVVALNRGVASTLYFKNFLAINDLANYAVKESSLDPKTTDMIILANYYYSHTDQVRPLPFGPMMSEFYSIEIPPNLMEKWQISIKYFGGVFDGNDIGTFLFGTDPRNRRGKSIIRSGIPDNFALIKKWIFSFDPIIKEPQVIKGEGIESLPIFSLHITNKRLIYFLSKSQKITTRIFVRNASRHTSTRIYLTVLFAAMTNYLLRELKSKKS
jgi:hypothetical protein